jgi:hypothetical protein
VNGWIGFEIEGQQIERVDNRLFDKIKTVSIELEDGFSKAHKLPFPPREEWLKTEDKIAHVTFRQ